MIELDIMDSVDLNNSKFSSVIERYYTAKYCTQFSSKEKNLDQCVSFHTNRICLISLAEEHEIVKNKKEIVEVNFLVNNLNRLDNKSSGKGKHGAQKLNPNSILCYLCTADGSSYPVYSCIKGKLLEVNENITKNPQLIVEKPKSEGYIALILPYLDSFQTYKDSMLAEEEYRKQTIL